MPATEIPEGYMQNAQGHLVPLEQVKPVDLLIDQTVRKIIGYADSLSEQIGRFKGHTFDDVAVLLDLLAEEYDHHRGGDKGNVTLPSYDGCLKVTIQVQDKISFGPELQIAKSILDEVIASWTVEARSEIRALVNSAFDVGEDGKLNRALLFGLRRLHIEDEGWKRAMQALTDSIRIIGSAEYVRFYRRPTARDRWEAIPIDLAAVKRREFASAHAAAPAEAA